VVAKGLITMNVKRPSFGVKRKNESKEAARRKKEEEY